MSIRSSRTDRLRYAFEAAFAPVTLEIADESARHAGHTGAAPGGETHFRVRIVSRAFEGQSRVQRQRLVNDAAAGEFAAGLHALSLATLTPDEAARRER